MPLLSDQTVAERIFDHIDAGTTDRSDATWREPVEHYRSEDRLAVELERVFRRHPTPFCPSAALAEPGSYVARDAAGTPIVAVRGRDGRVRAFRNACRHRGTQVADGSGCAQSFVCSYHGWTYGLDGGLRHVPHEDGFPDLDKEQRGLVSVTTTERHGLVFVTQEEPARAEPGLDDLPELLVAPTLSLVNMSEREAPANWKVLMDGYLEGYHIRSTHRETFYPVQFDNLNVVETFGRNSRITFPYRNIEKLRDTPPETRSTDGVWTYVYHLFPNVAVATFPTNVIMVVHEPVAVDRTNVVTFTLAPVDSRTTDGDEMLERANDFVLAGGYEDAAVACSIQRSLGSRANKFFEFGQFEGAVTHFHRALTEAIEESP